jgi:hypothetical protein
MSSIADCPSLVSLYLSLRDLEGRVNFIVTGQPAEPGAIEDLLAVAAGARREIAGGQIPIQGPITDAWLIDTLTSVDQAVDVARFADAQTWPAIRSEIRRRWRTLENCASVAPRPAQAEVHQGYLGLFVDEANHTVSRDGQTVEFGSEEKPWQVFLYLFESGQRHRDLLEVDDLWDSPHTSNAVQKAISTARKILNPLGVTIKSESGPRYFLALAQ